MAAKIMLFFGLTTILVTKFFYLKNISNKANLHMIEEVGLYLM